MSDGLLFPFGIYDKTRSLMLYIGLHANAADCWRIYLGWPSAGEVEQAQADGKVCLTLTMTYNPEQPVEGFAA